MAGESSVEMDISDMGIDPRDMEETGELEYVVTPHPELLRQTFIARAKSWVGHKFQGDEKEQCANFIRRLMSESGIRVLPAKRPFDFHLTGKLEQGPSFANSFFSAENGLLLGFSDLKPGDLVAFRDTYEGDFPEGCITHVGVWVSEMSMVDRATAGEPVRELVLNKWWKTRFVVGLRPQELC
jgi:cell wall-associated NlpC family hydrolase